MTHKMIFGWSLETFGKSVAPKLVNESPSTVLRFGRVRILKRFEKMIVSKIESNLLSVKSGFWTETTYSISCSHVNTFTRISIDSFDTFSWNMAFVIRNKAFVEFNHTDCIVQYWIKFFCELIKRVFDWIRAQDRAWKFWKHIFLMLISSTLSGL